MNDSDFMVKIETNIAKSGYGVVILLTKDGVVEDKFASEVENVNFLPMIVNDACHCALEAAKKRAEQP